MYQCEKSFTPCNGVCRPMLAQQEQKWPATLIMGCFLHKNQVRFQQGYTYHGGDRVHDTSCTSYSCRCCPGGTDCIRPRADPGKGLRTDWRCCQPGGATRCLPRSVCFGLSSWPQLR